MCPIYGTRGGVGFSRRDKNFLRPLFPPRPCPRGPDGFTFTRMDELSHVDEAGRVAMVDTSAKPETARRAVASARVLMSPATVAALRAHRTPKGDPLETARLAGIMAAKRTADLIPLCHPLPLTHVEVRATLEDSGVYLEAEAATNAQTGVEMEALTAAAVAALTVYDMCKAVEKGMTITEVRLERKTGGKSGKWEREKE
jgi:cyclic pyranopterin monophosphate synthase